MLNPAAHPSPPFFNKIRDLKNLGGTNPAIFIFDPQDVPDRPLLIRNILRIPLQIRRLLRTLGLA